MNFKLLLIIQLLLSTLFCEKIEDYSPSMFLEGEPSSNISHCVNAISGSFFIAQNDLEIPGREPLAIPRLYLERNGVGQIVHFPHLVLKETNYFLKEKYLVDVREPTGAMIHYVSTRPGTHKLFRLRSKYTNFKGFTNTSGEKISGKTNILNNHISFDEKSTTYTLHVGDGTKRVYQRGPYSENNYIHPTKVRTYFLAYEQHPNGTRTNFEYENSGQLKKVYTSDSSGKFIYAWASFTHHKDPIENPKLKIEASDGQSVEYHYRVHDNEGRMEMTSDLTKVCWGDGVIESVEMDYGINARAFSDRTSLQIERYKKDSSNSKERCVRFLRAPLSPTGEMVVTHRFTYCLRNVGGDFNSRTGAGHTNVYDGEGNQVRYIYDDNGRPIKTNYLFGIKQPIFYEYFFWDSEGDLIKKTYKDADDNHYLTRSYTYDSCYNIIKEQLKGNLTGSGQEEEYTLNFTYTKDGYNLITQKQEGDNEVLYTYLEGTNLPTRKLFLYKNRIIKRYFYFYDELYRLICEFCDDGITSDSNDPPLSQRTIKRFTYSEEANSLHMLAQETNLYLQNGIEHPLDHKKYFYNERSLLSRVEVYDSASSLQYSQEYLYDENRNLIEESTALGEKIMRKYDTHHNLIEQRDPNGLSTTHTYDLCFRRVSTSQKGRNGESQETQYVYDLNSRIKEEIQTGEKHGKWQFDTVGNLLAEEHFDGNSWVRREATYNPSGKPLTEKDGNGNITKFEYNCRGKPTRIIYPDGTEEQRFYNLDGTLAKSIDQSRRVTTFDYDFLNRLIQKTISSEKGTILETEKWEYNTFHLISHTHKGITTNYRYDGAGRKIEEIQKTEEGSSSIFYNYDRAGNIKEERKLTTDSPSRITAYTYDVTNRLLSEKTYNEEGEIFSHVLFVYDLAGNTSQITHKTNNGEAVEYFFYDAFNRLIKKTDSENRTTKITYTEENGTIKTLEEPGGRITTKHFNPLGQLQKQTIHCDKKLLQHEEFYYDKNGNKTQQDSYINGDKKVTTWKYNTNSDLIELHEGGNTETERTTSFIYNKERNLEAIQKPDGNQINYIYNEKGLEEIIRDSSGTIHYLLEYDEYDRLTSAQDHIHQMNSWRKYDSCGQLLEDHLANGHLLCHTYDLRGRKTALTLPDKSEITYQYDTFHLREISRNNSTKEKLYRHRYLTFEKGGKPLLSGLIFHLGFVRKSYLPSGRQTRETTPISDEIYEEFDPSGNLLAKSLSLEGEVEKTTYQYDPLSQLTCESGNQTHTYLYDSHHNRIRKNQETYKLNSLNQLTELYEYDKNGRPIERDSIHYYYDGLDRLIKIETPSDTTEYRYDYWNRRVQKIHLGKTYDYLYDEEDEIGLIEGSQIQELRVLGLGRGAEIGATVAIEIQNKVYAPIHSITGDIIALIDAKTGKTACKLTYTAFGEHAFNGIIPPPWRYQSKRFDPETSLTFFGRRYYDPVIGRFTTPDPKGLPEISNLYPYVLNNPLSAIDHYGLTHLIDGEYPWAQPDYYEKEKDLVYAPSGEDIIVHYYEQNLAEKNPEKVTKSHYSTRYDLGRTERLDHRYNIFANGIGNKKKDFFSHMEFVSDLSGGYNVHGIHNSTHGIPHDLLEVLFHLHGVATEPVEVLRDLITDLMSSHKNATGKLVAHSQGAAIASLALRLCTPEIREKVDVATIAGARFISNDICNKAYNFVSRDFVPNLQSYFKTRYPGELKPNVIKLKPHKWNIFMDHEFQSPTYRDSLEEFLNN